MPVAGRSRQMRIHVDYADQADGSCLFQSGGTAVAASVSGPCATTSNEQKLDGLAFQVKFLRKAVCGSDKRNVIQTLIGEALEATIVREMFPRAALIVNCQELQDEGSLDAVAITAAGLATLLSKIPAKGYFCGVRVCASSDGQMEVDPTHKTEREAAANFLFVFKTDKNFTPILISSVSTGAFKVQHFALAQELATSAAKGIFVAFEQRLERELTVGA